MFTKISLLLALSAACAHAQIDLTPHASVREFEGIQFPRLEFRDGKSKITYEPPRKWQSSGRGANKVVLTPPDANQAQAAIERIDASLPPFEEQGVDVLRQHALTLVPPQSGQPAVESVEPNRTTVGGNPTCEVTSSFTQFGHRLKMSVLSVQLGSSHLRFTLLCREPDFAKLHGAFRASVASWQWSAPAAAKSATPVSTVLPASTM